MRKKLNVATYEVSPTMSSNEIIELYEDQQIRTAWNETEEEWYFSVVDTIRVLADSKDPLAYW